VDGVLDFLEHFVEFEFEVVYVVFYVCVVVQGVLQRLLERADVRFHVCLYPLRVFRDDVVQEQVRPVE
jgi:hypothetical protein